MSSLSQIHDGKHELSTTFINEHRGKKASQAVLLGLNSST